MAPQTSPIEVKKEFNQATLARWELERMATKQERSNNPWSFSNGTVKAHAE
jgi:hypothetical protein